MAVESWVLPQGPFPRVKLEVFTCGLPPREKEIPKYLQFRSFPCSLKTMGSVFINEVVGVQLVSLTRRCSEIVGGTGLSSRVEFFF